MANQIVGVGTLGWSFDIWGDYTERSKKFQLFKMDDSDVEFTSAAGVTYAVPKNVNVSEIREGSGEAHVYSDKNEFSEKFSADAGIDGMYKGFGGQFSASFSEMTKSDSEYMYCIMESKWKDWSVKLMDTSTTEVTSSIRTDLIDVIPAEYTTENASLFFSIFRKYGTHFVVGASTGSRLYYNIIVKKSHGYSKEEIKVKAKLEFGAALNKFGAHADADWEKVGEEWVNNRTVKILAKGGTQEILDGLQIISPEFKSNFYEIYKDWNKNAAENPGIVHYDLREISELFGVADPRRAALNLALKDYIKFNFYLESKLKAAMIQLNGNIIKPENPQKGSKSCGFQAVIFEIAKKNVVFSKLFWLSFEEMYERSKEMFDDLAIALDKFNDKKYVIALASFGMGVPWFPSKRLYDYLINAGAWDMLRKWEDYHKSGGYSLRLSQLNYVFVGIPGQGSAKGYEDMKIQNCYNPEWWWEQPQRYSAPMASETVLYNVHLAEIDKKRIHEKAQTKG
ncbi:MAG: hypothetical protein JEY96_02785 [Bacteroidales bacterium]|nr:hypothetical protein [Bacteroidales bacterium]